ncbi:MAG: peptidoglycan-binding protein [Alphaproteobacteria bacterium]|nr:peptidoglycan-binding protein [Alphaproteobacteria bacterium]
MKPLRGNAVLAVACCGLALSACSSDQPSTPIAFDPQIQPAAAPPSFGGEGLASAAQFPPDPKPGHCYARVLLPATYDISEEKVLVRPAETKIEIEEARYAWGEEAVLIKEASMRLETMPAEYETVTELVLVKPEGRELVTVPAKYQTTTERILDKPAHTVWKRGKGPIDNALKTTYDESTGEVMCLVAVPATYRTIEKRTLITPATTKELITPAEYKTVTKKRLKTPATTREVTVPAEYETVRVQKLIEPAREREVDVAAQYETVSKRAKLTDEKLAWREVLCDVNMTSDLVRSIQSELSQSGHYGGRIDGLFGPKTIRAVNSYAKAKELPVGTNYIAIETAKALGAES